MNKTFTLEIETAHRLVEVLNRQQLNSLKPTKVHKDWKTKHEPGNKESTKQKTSEKLRRQLVALRGN